MFKLLSVLLVLWFLYLIREVFPPFIVGGIFAYLLLPLVNQIVTRLKVPPKAAVAIIYVGALLLLVSASLFGGGTMAEQFNALVAQRNEIVVSLVQQMSDQFHWQLDVEHTAQDMITSLENTFGSPGEIVHLGGLLSKSLLAVLVCIVSSIYLMIDSKNVGRFLLRFVPKQHHANIKQLSSRMNVMLSNYVRGQIFLIALMSCVAYCILHFVFQLKFALPIAVLSGFLEIIPVLGPAFAIAIAATIGVAQKGVSVAVWIILSYWIARLVEDYVIVPRFIGHAEIREAARGVLHDFPVTGAAHHDTDQRVAHNVFPR